MELYIKVSFWIGAFAFCVRTLMLMVGEFPIKTERSLSWLIAEQFISMLFLGWAGYLVFIQ